MADRTKQLTLRGMIIGIVGAIVITTSSMYVALRMGALPWPTIFVAIMSMALLKLLGKTNLNEINVTHTAMSAGAMVAGGLAFTIPGIWILDSTAEVAFWPVLVVTLGGTLLGTIFTSILRSYFIEKQDHPYPIGTAAYETVTAGDEGGGKAKLLFATMGLTAVFVAVRDWFGKIPGAWTSNFLAGKNIFFGIWVSPMALGIGYIIGPLYTGVWFLGAVLAYFFLIPAGVAWGWFADVAQAQAFRQSLGIGLMVGTGVGLLIKGIIPRLGEIFNSFKQEVQTGKNPRRLVGIPLLFAVVAFCFTVFTDMALVPSLLTIVGVWLTTSMAALITGQTGINPMEIFGMLVMLAIKVIYPVANVEAFLIAAVVAVACGLTGDVLNDFKAGYLLKTKPRNQLIAESVGGLIGAVVATIVLFVLYRAYGGFGTEELPAPQAAAVSAMVGGLPHTWAFVGGLVVGTLLYVLNVPGMTLGLGIYLPMFISSAAFIGGLANFIVNKIRPAWKEKGTVLSSGMLGGEGITGVVIAIIRVITGG